MAKVAFPGRRPPSAQGAQVALWLAIAICGAFVLFTLLGGITTWSLLKELGGVAERSQIARSTPPSVEPSEPALEAPVPVPAPAPVEQPPPGPPPPAPATFYEE